MLLQAKDNKVRKISSNIVDILKTVEVFAREEDEDEEKLIDAYSIIEDEPEKNNVQFG